MRNIIAFTGKAGSGKDYQCKLLMKNGYTKVAFADSLRYILRNTLSILEKEFSDNYEIWKSTHIFRNITLRNMLENLAATIRYYQPEFFADALITTISQPDLIDKDICISDLRYINEYYKLKNYCKDRFNFKLILCDYHSQRYQETNNHESAKLSNLLVKLGYKDLQEITESHLKEIEEYEKIHSSC